MSESVVTMAVKLPTTVGLVEKVTVIEVGVAAVTTPIAPLLNATVLSPAVVSKPKPSITRVPALAEKFAVEEVTTGATVATWISDPLMTPFVTTTADNGPAEVGFVERVTVNCVADAVATVPIAPLLNVTRLLPAVRSKPKPLIVTLAAFAARELLVVLVTTGITVANWMAEPLAKVLVVTTAVRLPAEVGFVDKETVSSVAVAVVTVPTASLLNTIVLLLAVVSKPKPAIVSVAALADRFAVLAVTAGITVAA